MSNVTYRHDNSYCFKKKGVKHVMKESIIDGEKGLSFHFLKKIGEEYFFSITVRQTGDDVFSVLTKTFIRQYQETLYDKQEESDVNIVDLMKLIKANKDLDYVNHFLTKERNKYK